MIRQRFWRKRKETNTKVGVLGSGDVAKSLGGGFLKHGHDVMIGTRTPAKLADWAAKSPKGRTGGFSHAAEFGEIVVLAVKGTAAAGASSGGARLFLTLRPAVLGQQCLEVAD